MSEIRSVPASYRLPAERGGRLEEMQVPGFSSALVYLPYSYEESGARYPVYYLLHGGGGEPRSFFAADNLLKNQLDHMIENGDIRPMIVCAPTYYAPGWTDTGVAGSAVAVAAFSPVLRDKIIPAVDAAYRTLPDRRHRAMSGFSMGGVATWQAFIEIPEMFYWYMPLSGDCWAFGEKGGSAFDRQTAALLAEKGKESDWYIHALTGDKDIAYPNLTAQIEAMKQYPEVFAFGKNIFYSVLPEGYHDYPYMHRYIYHALPEMFRS